MGTGEAFAGVGACGASEKSNPISGEAVKWARCRQGGGGGRSTTGAKGTTEPRAMGRTATSLARHVQGQAG
jgi:hypothetical protein